MSPPVVVTVRGVGRMQRIEGVLAWRCSIYCQERGYSLMQGPLGAGVPSTAAKAEDRNFANFCETK